MAGREKPKISVTELMRNARDGDYVGVIPLVEARRARLRSEEFRARDLTVDVRNGRGQRLKLEPGEKTPLAAHIDWYAGRRPRGMGEFEYLDAFAALVKQLEIEKGNVTFRRLGWHNGEPACSVTVHPTSELLADAFLEVLRVLSELRAASFASPIVPTLPYTPAADHDWQSPTRLVCFPCMVLPHCTKDLPYDAYRHNVAGAIRERAATEGDVAVVEVDDYGNVEWITITPGPGDPATLHARAWDVEQQLHDAAKADAFLELLRLEAECDDADRGADGQ